MRKSPQRPARSRRPRPREAREPSTVIYACLISSRDEFRLFQSSLLFDPAESATAGNSGCGSRRVSSRRFLFGKELAHRSEEHTSELQSLMRISYAVFCLKKKKITTITTASNLN